MSGHQELSGAHAPHEQGYQRMRDWLHDRCGMIYPEKKKQLLIYRMQRVCERYGVLNIEALVDRLQSGRYQDMEFAVIHAASTNHTYFFREPQVLDFFKDVILPTLPQEGGRIWSAAASTGDEAYTLAIMAAEARGLAWTQRKLAILGTDISDVVIAHAESGIYGGSHIAQMPAKLLERYFDPVGMDQYRVQDDLRRVCTFRRLNLKTSPYPFQKDFHVVFCRNVLYYFDRAQQRAVIDAIYDVTEPGGWLLTSVTVSLRELGSSWIPVQSGVYRKAG
ncbi:CheR family methyltransferase [Methylobacter sp.]|uniref:CheR family methyltransferase n=1 Tax=Methylobacter sp. TaxID=2051955 RepID=UPI002FDD2505